MVLPRPEELPFPGLSLVKLFPQICRRTTLVQIWLYFGDINCDMFKDILHYLCDVYDFRDIILGPTCFKDGNSTLIDVFLTDKPNSFCNCINIDTRINYFHNLTGVISKVHATQSSKHLVAYRSMKHFDQKALNGELNNAPYMSVMLSMMLIILPYGPSNINCPVSSISTPLWSTGSSGQIKSRIWMDNYTKQSTRGICGAINTLKISGTLPPGRNMCTIGITL